MCFQRLARIAGLSAIVVVMSGAATAHADTEVGSWSRTGSLIEVTRRLNTGVTYPGSPVTLADGRVLEFPGEAKDSQIYDPASGTWAHGPYRLQKVEGQWSLVALAEGGALLIGATPCEWPTPEVMGRCLPAATVYRWSPGEVNWLQVAPMHEARVRPVAVLLPDGRVLVAGGFGDHECPESEASNERYACKPLASAEVYDPATNEWTPTTPMPQARGGAVGALLSDGSVLVVGGDEADDAIRYDPASESWTAAGQTAKSRTGSRLFALPGDRALVLDSRRRAGFYGSPPIEEIDYKRKIEESAPCSSGISSEVFDATTNAWAPAPTAPVGGEEEHCEIQSVLLAGGEVLLRNDGELRYYVLDGEQRCWSTAPLPLEAHNWGEIVALSNGRALVFGGYIGGEWLSTAEVYTSGTPICASPTPSPAPVPSLALIPIPSPTPSGPLLPLSPFTGATLNGGRRLTITHRGSIRVQVQCPASATSHCIGQMQISLVVAATARTRGADDAKRVYLGDASFTVEAGETGWVMVRITDHMRMLRALIDHRRHVTVAVTTLDHDDGGQAVMTTASATLHS